MPQRKLQPCKYNGCNRLARSTYCDIHTKEIDLKRQDRRINTDRSYNRARYSRDRQSYMFYHSDEWQALRREALVRDNALCQDCKQVGIVTPAVEVHHIVPIKQEWNRRYSIDNLLCLCKECHNKRHNR